MYVSIYLMCTIQEHVYHPTAFLILHSYFLYITSVNHNPTGFYFYFLCKWEKKEQKGYVGWSRPDVFT